MMQGIFQNVWDWITNLVMVLVNTFSFWDVIDILIVTILVYELIVFVRKTRATQLLRGIALLVITYFLSDLLNLRTVYFLINTLLQFGLIALVVVFQPEIRRALEQVGQSRFAVSVFSGRMTSSQIERWRDAVVTICDSAERMARLRTGALIVIERTTSLLDIERTGTKLDSQPTKELLETIFYEGSPLHDGAVIINNARISAAGCLLPVSQNPELSRDMGTRHRAAVGLTESSDALVVVVSEESGVISLAQNGMIVRRLDRANLYRILENDLIPKDENDKEQKNIFRRLFKNGK